MNPTQQKYLQIQDEARAIFMKKNKDYGNAFSDYGTIGVLVRMNDKIRRLQTITKNKITMVNDESLRDTLLDLLNYSALALVELDSDSNAGVGSGSSSDVEGITIGVTDDSSDL